MASDELPFGLIHAPLRPSRPPTRPSPRANAATVASDAPQSPHAACPRAANARGSHRPWAADARQCAPSAQTPPADSCEWKRCCSAPRSIDCADGCGSRGRRRHLMRRRKIRVEGSFADAANNHGYKRARWRGRERMTVQNLMIATVQNTRKLLRWGQGSRREGLCCSVRPALPSRRRLRVGPRSAEPKSGRRRRGLIHPEKEA